MPGRRVLTLFLLLAPWILAGCDNNPHPPEGNKVVLFSVLGDDPKSLDPIAASDVLSNAIVCQIYDSLYQFHYLKRPYQVIPNVAAAMPTYSKDELTLTIPLKKGVRFQDDPCFPGGQGREVVASDFVYSIKRLADAACKGNGFWTLKGKVVGLDEFHKASIQFIEEKAKDESRTDEKLDYGEHDVEGVRALDDHTIRIKLKKPYPQIKYILAMSFTSLVPREAVEYYGEEFVNHPVGTGAFRMKRWAKGHEMILAKNPTYRDEFYPAEGMPEDVEEGLLKDAGKKLPRVDEIRYVNCKEDQPAWIMFLQGYCDTSGIPKDNFDRAVPDGQQLSPVLAARGIRLKKRVRPIIFYLAFNMRDPVVGNTGDPKQDEKNRCLRQAMSCAYDRERIIKVFLNGRGIPARSMLPPGITGHDPDLENPYAELNLELARDLLAKAGYPGGKRPDGERLVINFDTTGDDVTGTQMLKALVNDMAEIGVKIEVVQNTWAQLQKKVREGNTQFYRMGWVMDFPDPQNFLQLLYGPNKSPGPNGAHFNHKEYNELFGKMEAMRDSPDRLKIIQRMIEIANTECPWIVGIHSKAYGLYHQWALNRKPNDISGNFLKYVTVDRELRAARVAEWNRPLLTPLWYLAGALALVVLAVIWIGRHLPPRLATRKPKESD